MLDINRLHYNFVRRHSTLRFGGNLRTPAMQAGITTRPLTLREIFLWQRPPSKGYRARLPRQLVAATPYPWAA